MVGNISLQKKKTSKILIRLVRDRYLYLFLLPGLLYFLVFRYLPFVGLAIAFKDFMPAYGFWESDWVGFKHFERLLRYPDFWKIFKNTFILNFLDIGFAFPIPIVIALMLNEIRKMWYRKTVQTIIYLPHFLSWIVMGGFVLNILSPSGGVVNKLIEYFGGEPIHFMASSKWWRPVYVISGIWKEAGWSTILYLAAIVSIDPGLYEAAMIDGASKWQQATRITLPSITSTIIVLLILKIGKIMDINFDRIYILMNGTVRDVSEVFSTYVYRIGIQGGKFSFTTAIGIFQSVIATVLVLSANYLGNKFDGKGIW